MKKNAGKASGKGKLPPWMPETGAAGAGRGKAKGKGKASAGKASGKQGAKPHAAPPPGRRGKAPGPTKPIAPIAAKSPGGPRRPDPHFDREAQRMDSLGELRRTLRRAGLEQTAVLLVASSQRAAQVWQTPLALVFIDGGHSHAQAHADYEGWAPKVQPGGILAIHDLFPDPNEGGQAPIEIYRRAIASGDFEELPTTKTLGVLRRK